MLDVTITCRKARTVLELGIYFGKREAEKGTVDRDMEGLLTAEANQ